MFSNLRQGATFYTLYKGQNPRVEIGSVTSVTKPAPLYPTTFPQTYPPQQEMVVDVVVKVGDSTQTYEKLPANLTITDNKDVVVSCDSAAINNEIENMRRTSQGVLDSIEYHKSVVSNCDGMLRLVNPAFAKEKEQEEKIAGLEDKIQSIEGGQSQILNMLSELLKEKKPSTNNKKTE